jgi:hypothetical protein
MAEADLSLQARKRTGLFHLLPARRRWAILALWIFAAGYGGLVEIRGALIHNRHTDAGVYFAASWSLRIGSDPYFARDQNGWHYLLPPLMAVLASPLADAPPTMHRYWLLPYAWSVGIWYILGVASIAVGVNRLAMALLNALRAPSRVQLLDDDVDPSLCDPECPALPARHTSRRWAWRWWILCFWPVALCLPAICRSVIRGQVGPIWLMLVCLMIADAIEQRHLRSGLWLAGAICVKLIPAFLLLYPLWRLNWRMLLGCGVGLLVGLVIIPWMAMGTHDFLVANQHYLTTVLLPGVTGGTLDPVIANELVNPITTDTQSLVSVLMHMGNTFFGTPLSYSPPAFARIGHVLIGAFMTMMTLAAARFGKLRDPLTDALFLGCLVTVSLPIAPVCHPHYLMLMLPLVAAVLAAFLGSRGERKVTAGWVAMLILLPLSHIITAAPGGQIFRDTGVVTWAALAFWAAATRLLWKRTHTASEPEKPTSNDGLPAIIPLQPAM